MKLGNPSFSTVVQPPSAKVAADHLGLFALFASDGLTLWPDSNTETPQDIRQHTPNSPQLDRISSTRLKETTIPITPSNTSLSAKRSTSGQRRIQTDLTHGGQTQGEHNGRLLINVHKADMGEEGDTDTDSGACTSNARRAAESHGADYKCRITLERQRYYTD
jgi:hypothetical protein